MRGEGPDQPAYHLAADSRFREPAQIMPPLDNSIQQERWRSTIDKVEDHAPIGGCFGQAELRSEAKLGSCPLKSCFRNSIIIYLSPSFPVSRFFIYKSFQRIAMRRFESFRSLKRALEGECRRAFQHKQLVGGRIIVLIHGLINIRRDMNRRRCCPARMHDRRPKVPHLPFGLLDLTLVRFVLVIVLGQLANTSRALGIAF